MNENDFKVSLSKVLERFYSRGEFNKDFADIYATLPDCNLSIEYTGIFSGREWNTYRAVLRLQCPIDKLDLFEKYSEEILAQATLLFGKQDDYFLTSIVVAPMIERTEMYDFTILGANETLKRAIMDATSFMVQGRYSSCIDRVHTAIHGYLRKRLDDESVAYQETDTLPKLITLLYREWEHLASSDIDEIMLKSLRSASATLDALNDIRNRHSLAHPNPEIIEEPEAKLVLGLAESIMKYVSRRNV